MADMYDANGNKVGYTNKSGAFVSTSSNGGGTTEKKKFESKSSAEMQLVRPTKPEHKFEPFEKIFAWKTTKRFGLMNVNAVKQKDQVLYKDGKPTKQSVKDGFEKWVITLKDATKTQTLFGIFNVKKQCLNFDMGTTKCCVNVRKKYFSFITPEGLKNKKK